MRRFHPLFFCLILFELSMENPLPLSTNLDTVRFYAATTAWFIICSEKSNFLNLLPIMINTNCYKYRCFWYDCANRKQVRSFCTLRQMNGYIKTQCKPFSHRIIREIHNGQKYEQFVLVGNTLMTKSALHSLIDLMNESAFRYE